MSGIVGVFRRNGSPVQESDVRRMVTRIAHRGPDGSGVTCMGSVGFGHAMLWTTPESLHEQLPLVQPESGLAITADARIDNRDELMDALEIRSASAEIADSELILASYRKWGQDCCEHLIGDFAFAIWDETNQHLFCARDPMGIKCVYYFASAELFAFGSEIKSLLSLPEVPTRLNELRVLDYLASIFDDRKITFYKEIYRLPAASQLTVNRHDLRIKRHWSLDASRELKLSSDSEYTEAFLDCFTRCVRSRTRSAFPVGSALSGGLDSSSIACLAAKLANAEGRKERLHTFSLIFPSVPESDLPYIDERKYINLVLDQGDFQAHFVQADKLSPLKDVQRVQQHLDEAFFEGNLYLHWAMYETANKAGVRVFLDGLDGDTTISHGFEYLSDLVLGFRWKKLYNEIRLLSANLGLSRKMMVREYCIKPLSPTWFYRVWRRLHGRDSQALEIPPTFIGAHFGERLGLNRRLDELVVRKRSCTRSAREKHWEMLNYPLYAHALEVADKAAAAFGLEARYPFFDRRLIELCLALPPAQKLGQGWSRLILRRAMENILPKEIQWRPAKGDLSSNFYRRLLDCDRNLLDDVILKNPSELEPYIDLASIRQAYEKCNANPIGHPVDSINIFAAVNLAIWLRTVPIRP